MFKDDDVKFINDFIDRNKYYVEVLLIENGTDYKLIHINYLDEILEEYKLYENGVIVYNNIENLFINPAFSKLYITLCVFKNLRINKLPASIIRCKNIDGKLTDRIEDLFFTLSEDDIKIETYALDLLKKMRVDKKLINKFDDELRNKGLYHSFNMLKGLI